MTFKVVFLHTAEHDLKELRGYIVKKFGRETWQATYGKIKASVNTIKAFPQEGTAPDELVDLNLNQYRQIISGMNRIIYETREQMIYIHIVCDTRKDLKALLINRLVRTS